MYRLSIAAVVTVSAVAITQIASAADLPVKAPAYTPPQVLSWTGWYAGVNAGYGWSTGTRTLDSSITSDFPDFASDGDAFTTAGRTTLNPKGGFGGGQIGYNWQRGNWLFGWEADFQGAAIKASRDFAVLANGFRSGGEVTLCTGGTEGCDDATALSRASSKLNVFGSFRGRIGVLATPTWLIYGTGGLAFGQVKDTLSVVACDCNDNDPNERIKPLSARTATQNAAMLGYAVGAGTEWMFAPSWSVKAEYQYIDLGSNTLFVTSDNSADHAEATAKFDYRYHTFRVGLNYHFGP